MQCAGSNIAAALIDGVEKHNARNPDNRIIYLNCGAVATELTNEKCSFWHFRFDANAEQKALMLVRALPPETKKVYLLNQDYLFGQSLKRDTERFLAKYRPDIEIVANELIPLQKTNDFSPYVSKIKASGAQVLITGNWGPDMSLLVKAGMDAGLDVKYYTLYAHLGGGPTAIGPGGEGRVLSLLAFSENVARRGPGGSGAEGVGRTVPAPLTISTFTLPACARIISKIPQASISRRQVRSMRRRSPRRWKA